MKKHPMIWLLPVALVLLAAGFFVQYHLPLSTGQAVAEQHGVVINEVMSKNESAFCDSQGDYYDWFEIMNQGSGMVNIGGWMVCRGNDATQLFVFPSQVLKPGECVLVYASGKNSATPGYAYQAAYKISSSGDTLALIDGSGVICDQVDVPPLSANQSYKRDGQTGEWVTSSRCSPALPNTQDNEDLFIMQPVEDALVISEVMADNATYLDGVSDYIEIHNLSDQAVDLSAYSLTDDPDKLNKWQFPQMTLGAGEYLLIYADGTDQQSADRLSTGYSLSKDGESVLLVKNGDQVVDAVSWDAATADCALSRMGEEWTTVYLPTPGLPNTQQSVAQMDAQFRQEHAETGLYITEVMCTTTQIVKGSDSYDWVEIYNAGSQAVDLSGMGLSNKPGSPRRWQFPEGATIKAGEYLIVYLSGYDFDGKDRNGYYHTNFRLSGQGGDTLTLCEADGTLIDRISLPQQYGNVSYGRVTGRDGLWYMDMTTPGEANTLYAYSARTAQVEFSIQGGTYEAGETLTLELSAQEGARIYYTLDCSDPTESSTPYTGPITISSTTIVRAAAYAQNELPSYANTQSYLFGRSHTVRVVSVVSDPDNLYSSETGILYGSGDYANYWKNWEREAHVEIYLTDGTQQISQGCGFKVHGAKSRELDQKSFKIIARSIYDESNRFEAALFEDLEFTEYQSAILRSGGQDGVRARMRDTLAASLAAEIGLLNQESELCVVYLNGEYYGQYEIRERINLNYLAQHLGLEDTSGISLIKDDTTLAGSGTHYKELMSWLDDHPDATDADLEYVDTQVDLENYIDYSALMVYTGNQDIGIRRYRDENGDGRWRWIVFDFDFAFFNDVNSMERWMDPDGAGWYQTADNKLFAYCIQNAAFRERFLTRLGELMSTCWTTEKVTGWIDAQYEALLPEMSAHFARWDFNTVYRWEEYVASLRDFVETRKDKLLVYIQEACELTETEMEKYFGNAK